MPESIFVKALQFAQRLDDEGIAYDLRITNPESLVFIVQVPGEHWEIEYCVNNRIQIELFKSDGYLFDESLIERLFTRSD